MELKNDDECEILHIKWSNNSEGLFPFLWLRENDPDGFHHDTQERITDLTNILLDLHITKACINDNYLHLSWQDTQKETIYNLDWLYNHRPGSAAIDLAAIRRKSWRSDIQLESIPSAVARDLLNSNDKLAIWLEETQTYGLSMVTGLEDRQGAGIEIAQKIGFLRKTNFGTSFEVQSKPNPNNLAYTSVALPPHTDLPNQELPPGFQFLHCIANEAQGGGSTFSDGLAISMDLHLDDKEAFEILSTTSIPFRFHDENVDIKSRKHVITLTMDGEINEICFNAHIADFLDIEPLQMKPYYRAYQKFMKMTRSKDYLLNIRLSPGQMVVFDNRRILHGREAFDPTTGFRHLQGCYVDRGEFESRLRVLKRTNNS